MTVEGDLEITVANLLMMVFAMMVILIVGDAGVMKGQDEADVEAVGVEGVIEVIDILGVFLSSVSLF